MVLQEDEVVISGIGGKFPQANNLGELSEKLFSGEDLMIEDTRKLTKGFYESIPDRNGKMKNNLAVFDYTFFGISKAAASAMDPMICHLLQRTLEAVIDAGINPSDLRGTNSSVFTGTCHSDSDLEWSSDIKVGYGIMGRNRCMNSNRISYWLDLNGSSYSTDCGWANGISNLYQGWNSIKSGKCDTAIVGVCSLQKLAMPALQLNDFGVLSPDGYTKCFDDSANGWGRGSAAVVMVLQRASIAKRNYATIGHVISTTIGEKETFISQPTQKHWEKVLAEFYKKSEIDPHDIHYVEAHGSGIREEDAAELNAITEIFCKNRKTPLLIGCVKSNVGHCESSSSFCGVAKAVISMEKGMIPRNLHYKKPNSLVPALAKGLIKVVDKNTPLPENAWVAVSSHTFGGTYGHVVLKPNLKNKVMKKDGIPRLVLLSDRTNDFMNDLFEMVESTPYDSEYIALLHEIHSKKLDRYFGRGYTILPKPENPIHENQVNKEIKRPIWFIFSGMGSQWPTMGKRLMDLPLFRESIESSHKLLEGYGLNLIQIITDDNPKVFDNILHSFVGIAAVQVALIDILKALNITPDGLIGHSVGELGCSYADGCFTSEQMILAAYYRGKASRETELIKGSMAAVGKGYNDIKDQLPDDIEVACHNSGDSCTLSGPLDSIEKFVGELKAKGVFARAVNVSNIAYHSRYIKPAAPILLKYLQQIVPKPKLRSSKWISTSNSEDKWDTDVAKYCSAEYHTNNLLSSVLFEEGSKHIPKDAICIEIAPHGLLQAILKRSFGDEVTNIPLTSRTCADPLIFLLQAIGKIYMAGVDVNIMNLYPKIEFPVSRGTPILSNLPHWHEEVLNPPSTPMGPKIKYSFKNQILGASEDGVGFVFNGKNKYPISIFLDLLWELYASQKKLNQADCPVVIQDFRLDRFVDVNLSEEDDKSVYFLNGSGDFEIVEEDRFLCSGNISALKEKPLPEFTHTMKAEPDLMGDEIYAELKRKGYMFGKSFKGLTAVSFSSNGTLAEIPAKANWKQVIESMIQLHLLRNEYSLDHVNVPTYFHILEISSLMHTQYKNTLSENSNLLIVHDFITNTVTCSGISLKRLNCCKIARVKINLNFKLNDFFPFLNPSLQNITRFAGFCFGIIMDNIDKAKKIFGINIVEIIDKQRSSSIGNQLQELYTDAEMTVKMISSSEMNTNLKEENAELLIAPSNLLDSGLDVVVEGGFFIVRRTTSNFKIPQNLVLIAKFVGESKQEYFLLKKNEANWKNLEFIKIDEESFGNFKELNHQKINYVITRKKPLEGIEDFKTKMQSKTVTPLRWMFILDSEAPSFDPENPFYSDQLKKGLTTNVYVNGNWGCIHNYNFIEKFENEVSFNLEENVELKPSYISFEPDENINQLEQIEFSGKLNDTKIIGIGRLVEGRRIVVDKNLTWKLPDSWSLEDGATVPISYAFAYYNLQILGPLKKSENVLVTDGMSCLGQAHISVALTTGSRVFVTVGSEEEMVLIKKMFPQIMESDIVNHNEPKFETRWKLNGEKNFMHFIVSLLDGDGFFAVISLVKEFGNIYHFGKEDLRRNTQLGTFMFLRTTSLYAESPEVISRMHVEDKKLLHDLIEKGIKSGVVKPLARITTTINKLQIMPSKPSETQTRVKSLLQIEPNTSNRIKFNTDNSYLVLGDETNLWIDIVEWILSKKVTNVVVGRRDASKRNLRIEAIENRENIFIRDHQDVGKLLEEVRKLGSLTAVFYLSTNSLENDEILRSLGQSDPDFHLIAITKCQGLAAEICLSRNKSGHPSTNFLWKADTEEIKRNLEYMTKICGQSAIIRVTPPAVLSKIDYRLGELLPNSIEDFCELGSSLSDRVEIIPLNTLSGTSGESLPEVVPFLLISGLQGDPVKLLQPFVSDFLYPAACVKVPNLDLTIPQMVSFMLPEIVSFNKGNFYNVVGISWGSHLAMELTKQLEEMGATVGLTLIEGPIQNAKFLVTESLEWDLLNLIQRKFKVSADQKGLSESLSELSWQGQLNTVLNALNLPWEKEKDFCRGAMFVYNNLKAFLEYDINEVRFAGPLSIVSSDQRHFDDKIFSGICEFISLRHLPVSSEELMKSKELWEIVHGSAIAQPMSRNTIHKCSWPILEEYMKQKEKPPSYEYISSFNVKFSFAC